jgi:hypothetical protein
LIRLDERVEQIVVVAATLVSTSTVAEPRSTRTAGIEAITASVDRLAG